MISYMYCSCLGVKQVCAFGFFSRNAYLAYKITFFFKKSQILLISPYIYNHYIHIQIRDNLAYTFKIVFIHVKILLVALDNG